MKSNIGLAIIRWYESNGRKSLPWRNTSNPYAILIAELMLQKTHAVTQVLPIYNIFIKEFPNPALLSKASIDEISRIIYSLGLQRTRSIRLKKLAEVLLEKFDGSVPITHEDLVSLPGVGEYVANAVQCMAFNQVKEMADANVGRVLGRVFLGKEEYPPTVNSTFKIAKELIQSQAVRCRELNFGIIDLGALVCTPKKPKCSICPLHEVCVFNGRLRVLDQPIA